VYFPSDVSGAEDDAVLVRQSLAGESESFGLLVGRYQHVMYTVALRMVGNAEDARDVTQDAFVKAYRQLATFDPNYRFFSWMYRIVINESFNAIRARRPHEPLAIAIAESGRRGAQRADSARSGGSPFETALAGERHTQIDAALQRLAPDYRTVVVLRHFAGQSYAEISEALSIPEKTVKSRLFTARQLLGEMLLGWRQHAKEGE
jgi:RNA polymerase sigma-70 factor (ECF subfamily)